MFKKSLGEICQGIFLDLNIAVLSPYSADPTHIPLFREAKNN
jgi:hypothetical protein